MDFSTVTSLLNRTVVTVSYESRGPPGQTVHSLNKKAYYMEIYVVQPNDTLVSIASRFGVSMERLIYDNQLDVAGKLIPGQAILILTPAIIHRVKQGETIYSIAQSYGIPVKQLLQNNPYLLNESYLTIGEKLVISYTKQPKVQMEVMGYAYPYIREEVLQNALLYLDELRVFSYGFTEEGILLPPENEDYLLKTTLRAGVSPILVLTPFSITGTFNNQLINVLVENIDVQSQLIEELMKTVREKGYDGVDVDFEYILPEDRVEYAAFVTRLRQEMNREGFRVSVALAPKTSPDQKGLLYEGMDYALLGEAADSVFLMTYEWGYTYGPPMAVAPLNKVRDVLDYAVSVIPRYKIYMGIPNYGYDWTLPFVRGTSRARIIGNAEAVQLAVDNRAEIEYDETAQSPHFRYTLNYVQHEVWFEDVRSIRAKLLTASEYDLHGFGFWNLMRPFRAAWFLIQSMIL